MRWENWTGPVQNCIAGSLDNIHAPFYVNVVEHNKLITKADEQQQLKMRDHSP